MMGCMSVQGTLDAIASERARLGTAARGDAVFEKRETDTYRGVLNQLSPLGRPCPYVIASDRALGEFSKAPD
jgi:hypothetical protein